jgi:hypothetical protein
MNTHHTRGGSLLAVALFVLFDAVLVGCGAPFEAVTLPGVASSEATDAATERSATSEGGMDVAVADGGADGSAEAAPDAPEASVVDASDAAPNDGGAPDVQAEAGKRCASSWACGGYGDAGGFDPPEGIGFCCAWGGVPSCASTCPSGYVVCIPGTEIPCPNGSQSCVVVDAGLALCQ